MPVDLIDKIGFSYYQYTGSDFFGDIALYKYPLKIAVILRKLASSSV
jgi:hypothetical protein